jgi:hypothetical protein
VEFRVHPGSTRGPTRRRPFLTIILGMNLASVVIVVLALAWVISRNLRGRFVAAEKPYRLPLILLVIGVVQFGQAHPAITPLAVLVLAADLVLTAVLGAARGYSIQLGTRDGFLYQRGGAPTLLLWALSIAVRVGLEIFAHSVGVGAAASATVLLTFSISLIVQALVLRNRVRADGRPVRPVEVGRRSRGDAGRGTRRGSGGGPGGGLGSGLDESDSTPSRRSH